VNTENATVNTKLSDEEKSVDQMDEERMEAPAQSNPHNSKIIGRVSHIYSVADTVLSLPFCNEVDCLADVEILALPFRGKTFHGQFNEGDTLKIQFVFTLESTTTRFPELNEPLPGLSVDDYFEAELFESDNGVYRVQLYERKG